jgi:hypothetical protein
MNPVSIGWELLPYSFVVDWFYDVGSYVRNWESAILYRSAAKGGWVTHGWIAGRDCRVEDVKTDLSGNINTYNLYGARTDSYKHRQPFAYAPRPVKPRFEVDLGWRRLLSAASLLYTGGKGMKSNR